ncbi:Hypothetical protein SRAE_2000143000 [Strongyloides ratti]|uniref:Uncharacterized protein n=1 Tax=Strongyloides ratti TaxID=34506 RepID=A0A090MY89_STRRB|nr:Hypothetical protein SRAE_2000143000 [Strongyloides ratti]CEF66764.1 Hypothetical protein SRAE_2000143000 [Strongyloides ratti]
MGANPCCCRLKDGSISIAIWSFIFSIVQLGIFGWQLAAIKYEKDRAANNLLPNYNTYGRFDIPSYYESYWQSPEERYYIGLFVCQIICAIVSFFLLFASVALIYGIHTLSRYLIWPWFPCMLFSILSSLAYCITWWAGDVRDYWIVLTIIEIFGVVINLYCFLVILVFYYRIGKERKVYEKRMLSLENDAFNYPSMKKDYSVPPKKHPYDIDAIEDEEYDDQNKSYYPNGTFRKSQKQRKVYDDNIRYEKGNSKLIHMDKYRKNNLEESRLLEWVKSTTDLTSNQNDNNMPIGYQKREYEDDGGFDTKPSRTPHYHNDYSTPADPPMPYVEDFEELPASAEASTMRSLHEQEIEHRHHKCKHYDNCKKKHKHRHRKHKKCHHSEKRKHYHDSEDFDSELTYNPSFHTESTFTNICRDKNSDYIYDHDDTHCSHHRRSRSYHKPRHRSCSKHRSPSRQYHSNDEDSKNLNNYPTLSLADLEKGFTIPQRIIIPPNPPPGPDGKIQPQTYHINSEIIISYDENGKPKFTNEIVSNSTKEKKSEKQILPGISSDV